MFQTGLLKYHICKQRDEIYTVSYIHEIQVHRVGRNSNHYHCQDNVPLDKNTCWQVAAAKLAEMEKLATAIQTEEALGEFIQDKPRRSVLCQTAAEFRKAVGQVSAAETRIRI